jgi:hypothetical protein
LIELVVTLFGWQEALFNAWYITEAMLGAAPLAIGTIYFSFDRRAGHIAAALLGAAVSITSIFVTLSPVRIDLVDPIMLSLHVICFLLDTHAISGS